MGKTVLLGEAASRAAEQYSWLTVPIEVRPERPFTAQLVERLDAARSLYVETSRSTWGPVTAATFRASVLGVGGEVTVNRSAGPAAGRALPLDAALAGACEAATQKDAASS